MRNGTLHDALSWYFLLIMVGLIRYDTLVHVATARVDIRLILNLCAVSALYIYRLVQELFNIEIGLSAAMSRIIVEVTALVLVHVIRLTSFNFDFIALNFTILFPR